MDIQLHFVSGRPSYTSFRSSQTSSDVMFCIENRKTLSDKPVNERGCVFFFKLWWKRSQGSSPNGYRIVADPRTTRSLLFYIENFNTLIFFSYIQQQTLKICEKKPSNFLYSNISENSLKPFKYIIIIFRKCIWLLRNWLTIIIMFTITNNFSLSLCCDHDIVLFVQMHFYFSYFSLRFCLFSLTSSWLS